MVYRLGPVELFLIVAVCLVLTAMVVAVVAVVVWLSRHRATGATEGGGSRALEVLKERYARGELTREQYEEMRRTLEQ